MTAQPTPEMPDDRVNVTPITRLLKRDIRKAISLNPLTTEQARFLVSDYYMMQDYRIATSHQARTLDKAENENETVRWFGEQFASLEETMRDALHAYAQTSKTGQWALEVVGIGPVLSAGLLAHIDVTRAPTVGHVWSFAGLNPGQKWEKGEKRPWNADLKVLCWKIGESFVKVSGNEKSLYGRLYRERKEKEIARNEAGEFADQAAHILEIKRIGKATDAYKAYSQGKLPPAHIHARAKRAAVKIFIAHWHDCRMREVLGKPAPEPYALAHLGHAHNLGPEVPYSKYV